MRRLFRFHPLFDESNAGGSGAAPTPTPPPAPAPAPAPEPTPAADKPEQSVPYARFKEVNDQLAALKAQQQQRQTEEQSLADRLKALETDSAATKLENARLKVIADKSVPAELHEFLQGSDEATFAASADKLLAAFQAIKPTKGPGVPPPAKGGKPAVLDIKHMTPQQIRDNRDKLWNQQS